MEWEENLSKFDDLDEAARKEVFESLARQDRVNTFFWAKMEREHYPRERVEQLMVEERQYVKQIFLNDIAKQWINSIEQIASGGARLRSPLLPSFATGTAQLEPEVAYS